MVGTMMSTPTAASSSSSNGNSSTQSSASSTLSTVVVNNNLLEQSRIVEGLLRQQPQILHTTVPGVPDIDYAGLIQTLQTITSVNNSPLKQFTLPEEPSTSSSSSPSSTVVNIIGCPSEPEYKPRNVREKVYADGYIMSFDKKSCCGTKYFWRCERKNDCNARMHSDITTREIVRKLHPHNHDKPTDEELAFYEQDFTKLDTNYCWPVKSINRSYMQRKLSRASHTIQSIAPPVLPSQPIVEPMEIDSKAMLQAAFVAASSMITVPHRMIPSNGIIIPPTSSNISTSSSSSSSTSSSTSSSQKRNGSGSRSPAPPIKQPRSPKAIKREIEEPSSSTAVADQMMNQEEFRMTYELTKKLMELMRPRTEINVTWNGDDGTLLLFLSNDNGSEENLFFPVVVTSKDEKGIRLAVEGFTGKRCEGQIVMSYSHRVTVLIHDSLIASWTHGKLLLVNTDSSSLWRLTPVDAFGNFLNSP